MLTIKEPFKTLLGILSAIFALYMGRMFWVYFLFSFGTPLSILVIPTMLGYIYIAINLTIFKKWAWELFLTIFLLAILVEILFVLVEGPAGNLIEAFAHYVFWISIISIPVFGISALIRKLTDKQV